MTAFITPQPDHQPLHIGACTIVSQIKTKQFMFCRFISQGRGDFESVGSSAIWVETDRLIIKNGNRTNRKHKYKPEFDSVNQKKSLVENVVSPQSVWSRAVWAVKGSSTPCLLLDSSFFTVVRPSPSCPT